MIVASIKPKGKLDRKSQVSKVNFEKPEKFVIKELQEIKTKLCEKKDELDETDDAIFNKLAYTIDFSRMIKQTLRTQYNAQVVTNAFTKMMELMTAFENKFIQDPDQKTFTSFSIAEAPGAFIPAMNHFVSTKRPVIQSFDWFAESYIDRPIDVILSEDPYHVKRTPDGPNYLRDDYHLMRNYQSRWLFGPNKDSHGDIMNPENIKYFKYRVFLIFVFRIIQEFFCQGYVFNIIKRVVNVGNSETKNVCG